MPGEGEKEAFESLPSRFVYRHSVSEKLASSPIAIPPSVRNEALHRVIEHLGKFSLQLDSAGTTDAAAVTGPATTVVAPPGNLQPERKKQASPLPETGMSRPVGRFFEHEDVGQGTSKWNAEFSKWEALLAQDAAAATSSSNGT